MSPAIWGSILGLLIVGNSQKENMDPKPRPCLEPICSMPYKGPHRNVPALTYAQSILTVLVRSLSHQKAKLDGNSVVLEDNVN